MTRAPILSTASATGRTSLWAASRCWTRTRTTQSSGGLREGEAVQAEDCFLTLTWDGEWDQWEIHITW